jgi:hypothetical protein
MAISYIFMVISYIFMVIWYIFPRFGILYQGKSGNPVLTEPKTRMPQPPAMDESEGGKKRDAAPIFIFL